MKKKKPIGYLDENLTERGVFVQEVSINYDDKFVTYMRGVKKTEIIDGKKVVGKKPNVPYLVKEFDKKSKKMRLYIVKLLDEGDAENMDAFTNAINKFYDEIKTDEHPNGASLRLA